MREHDDDGEKRIQMMGRYRREKGKKRKKE
jgi:hypothetical protein